MRNAFFIDRPPPPSKTTVNEIKRIMWVVKPCLVDYGLKSFQDSVHVYEHFLTSFMSRSLASRSLSHSASRFCHMRAASSLFLFLKGSRQNFDKSAIKFPEV